MNDMLQYWSEMFPEFRESELRFRIPGFHEPLMSADFSEEFSGIYFKSLRKQELIVETLEEAIKTEAFWTFHQENYPEGFDFLKRLLPFIVETRPGTHRHFYFREEGQIVASQLLGEGKTMSFLFNGVVAKTHRRRGLLNQILTHALGQLKTPNAFYWTKFEWLGDKGTEIR